MAELGRVHLYEVAKLALAVVLASCGGESSEQPATTTGTPPACAPPNRVVGDACREPGVQDDGCAAGTLGVGDGSCRAAGIPPEMCGAGFMPDGDVGCTPILPAEPCPWGEMAVPGDTACRAVVDCAAGTWGNIPVDASTEHVDGSFAGGSSDGSAQNPWTTIGEAIQAAEPGAIVAIAAGSYAEDVSIQGKSVVLWGVCPDQVEIAGTGAELAAVEIGSQADGTVLRGLAVTGNGHGLFLSGPEGVLIEGVWVHDNAGGGIGIFQGPAGAVSCTVRGSLVELNHGVGVFIDGSEATVEATVVRGTLIASGSGPGIAVQGGAIATVRGSLVDQNRDLGVYVSGSDATIEATVVRGRHANATGIQGRGIVIQESGDGAASTATVRSSVVDQNREGGVLVIGSEALVEATVVRDTQPDAVGVGQGILLQESDTGVSSNATVRSSVVDQNRGFGIVIDASEAVVESTVVRGTSSDSTGRLGRGIQIQDSPDAGKWSIAALRGLVIDQNHEFGVLAVSSEVTVEGCLVRNTLANAEARFGDGISAASEGVPAALSIHGTRVEESARAGVSSFGALVSLGETVIQCAAIGLVGERFLDVEFTFEDGGENVCGCPDADGTCVLETVGLEPPSAVASP